MYVGQLRRAVERRLRQTRDKMAVTISVRRDAKSHSTTEPHCLPALLHLTR
uniref:Uncharacterized protein n=1 Tax=Anguilla anguilla TaxID=7936 RepID=A0A0E9PPT6_ANGAN